MTRNAWARQALTNYALGPVRRISLLQDERASVFKVEAGSRGPYVLRIDHRREAERQVVQSECEWLAAIGRDTDLVVPEPIADRDGDFVTSVDAALATLTLWVPGRRRFRANGPGPDVLEKVGRLMARLHEHGRAFKPPRGFVCPRWDYVGLFGARSPWRPVRPPPLDTATRRLFDRVRRRARSLMQRLGTGRDVFGLIHGDLIQPNYLVDGRHVHAIDFADFGRGYFLYDMAVTLLMLRRFDRTGTQRAAFLRGYRSVRTLSREHEESIDPFIGIRATVLSRWLLGAREPTTADLQWVSQAMPDIESAVS
jgi:Ser/Thr protein kinase RdoA (MazF antagonist)